MTMSFTTRLVRLANHLGELRFRLQDAARSEVAHAIADALAEATRALIAGPAADIGTGRSRGAYDQRSEWDDPWDDVAHFSAVPIKEETTAMKEPFHYEAALASALAIARWILLRTGQPVAAKRALNRAQNPGFLTALSGAVAS